MILASSHLTPGIPYSAVVDSKCSRTGRLYIRRIAESGSVFQVAGLAIHRLHRVYLAGEVGPCIPAGSPHYWRPSVSTQRFRRSIVWLVGAALEQLGKHCSVCAQCIHKSWQVRGGSTKEKSAANELAWPVEPWQSTICLRFNKFRARIYSAS